MKKYLFVWLLPLIWTICSLLSFRFPGDEYALYVISSIAGVWITFVVQLANINSPFFLFVVTTVGALVMAVVGFLLAKLRIKLSLWLICFVISAVVICIVTINSYPSFDRAIRKNGSLFAYIFSSINLGLYCAVVLSAIIQPLCRLSKKLMRAGYV